MTVDEVMKQLEALGNEGTKKILMKHGAKDPFFGVKVADLKKILKKTKKNHELSLALYDTGNSDAMYLAGLMADESKMTKSIMNKWAKEAYWYMLSEYTVPWVASETPFGLEIGQKWIKGKKENIASAGWATLSSYASIMPDDQLDIKLYSSLLDQAAEQVHEAQNRVRYVMNGFVIAVGCYVPELTEKASKLGKKIGKVSVEMGGTACKVPLAEDYIKKVADKGRIGKKRKSARC